MKVLLVDDEPDIRKVGRLSLEAVGKFQTLVAASPAEALEIAARERPDLILLDMMMPGMDGLTALGELRKVESLATTPVIFMTARVQRGETERYLQAGAIGVIQKPFNPMTLPNEIKQILGSQPKTG